MEKRPYSAGVGFIYKDRLRRYFHPMVSSFSEFRRNPKQIPMRFSDTLLRRAKKGARVRFH